MQNNRTEKFLTACVKKTQTKDVEIVFDALRSYPDPSESAIPVGQNFFYKLKRTKDERLFSYVETGVGEFYKKNNKYFFRREHVFFVEKEGINFAPHNGIPENIAVSQDEKLILFKFFPEKYRNLFTTENSVLCCTDKYTPTPVELQNNTLLGKLDDIIQSIDQNELWSILLKNNKKPVEGSIRYNKKQKCFQGYDGKQWRTLMWGDE